MAELEEAGTDSRSRTASARWSLRKLKWVRPQPSSSVQNAMLARS